MNETVQVEQFEESAMKRIPANSQEFLDELRKMGELANDSPEGPKLQIPRKMLRRFARMRNNGKSSFEMYLAKLTRGKRE